MNTFKTIAKTIITLIIIGGCSSCEKTDVAPEETYLRILTIESLTKTYEIRSDVDYSEYTLFLPYDEDYNISMDAFASNGMSLLRWDMITEYFFLDEFNSTHDHFGLTGINFERRTTDIDENNPAPTSVSSEWDCSTWDDNIVVFVPMTPFINVTMRDSENVETGLTIHIQLSYIQEGLVHTP
ncbi:MAG: hypothetical protein GY751_15270 [Bacteroidetes bacterium]|nr:hypothetical protein [Bacteroidota bacterium]